MIGATVMGGNVVFWFTIIALVFIYLLRKKLEHEKEKRKNIKETKQIVEKFTKKLIKQIEGKYLNHKKYLKLHKEALLIYEYIELFYKYLETEHQTFFSFCENKNFPKKHNRSFIESEKKLYRNYFAKLNIHGFGLTEKQLEAVFCGEDATLVNAGAGTGKTKTIESKVLYLHDIKGIPLEDILVITYSKKSQEDMMKRICNSLDKAKINYNADDLKQTISTFHAFGKKIIDEYFEKQSSVKNKNKKIGKGFVGKQVIEEKKQDEILAEVLNKIKKTSWIQKIIGEYLLYYSAPELAVSDFKNLNEYYENTKRTYTSLIKDGQYNVTVKSHGELLIANFCIAHGVKIEYEPKGHYYTNEKGGKKSYKPDFYLPDYNIYIEYFGIDKHGKTADYIANDKYTTRMRQKIQSHKESGNTLIDLRYADLQNGMDSFLEKLRNELRKHDVKFDEITSYGDILQRKELSGPFVGLAKTLKTFLSLYKESSCTIPELKKKCGSFDILNTTRNFLFVKIFEQYLKLYTEFLDKEKYMDFGDMIVEAQKIIKTKTVKRNYKHILVDEFQDISEARAGLIQALTKDTKLFCVGDDWQSIYRFAGSNTNIFLNFNDYFGYTKHITLDKTFRFNQGISNVSGEFIMMNPEQTKKTLRSNNKELNDKISIFQENEPYESYTNLLNNLIDDSISKLNKIDNKIIEIEVLYLTRYSLNKYGKDYNQNFLSYLVNKFDGNKADKSGYKKTNISYGDYNIILKIKQLTIHKAKGLEADYVIVDYVNQNDRYNFPSSFDDDPVLGLVIEDEKKGYPFSEERRLFYVGITRGKNKALLVYNKNKMSLFLKELLLNKKTVNLNLQSGSTPPDGLEHLECPNCGGNLIISGFNSKFTEYYCSNYRMDCEFRYVEIDNILYESPHCPIKSCEMRMKLRKNSTTGTLFWGCPSYPSCKGTREFSDAEEY